MRAVHIRDPVDHQLRRQLGQVLCSLVDGDSGSRVAEFTGAHPSRISRLRSGKLAEFSIPWLMRAIAAFGYDFTLTVAPRPPAVVTPRRPSATVVRHDRFGRVVT